MTKRMLVDATHPEETRVAIVDSYRDNNRLEDLDFDLQSKPLLKGNIYLAKVMRVEPSLQAAFVEYGGNRHGFLSFSEIHPDYFRIPVSDRVEDEGDDENPGEETSTSFDSLEVPSEDDLAAERPTTGQPVYQDVDHAAEPQENVTEGESAPAPVAAPIEAPAAVTSAVDDAISGPIVVADAEVVTPVTPPSAATPANVEAKPDVFGQAASIDDSSSDVGLITDFGNAAVQPFPGTSDVLGETTGEAPTERAPEAAAEAEHVESVGGDMPERFVRRPQRPRYKIQEVVKRGMVMLVQVVKEERGNKGAALTAFLSLAGRYCVLMPNTDHGGGVSRKITNHQDRRRLKEILDQLEIPEGMAVILRTAGMEQDPPEIQRDLDYLLRLWNSIREQTLQSTAPSVIYEEANLIKRSVRDLYSHDISEILVSGEEGYKRARDFMQTIMPDDVEKIKLYTDQIPLFFRYNVESQIDTLYTQVVQLRSGGYLVINPTEALVSIDVNSGRATREHHIEETAVKTNLEAADEVARQLRLRDLAGLVVIDFIDMEDNRNNTAVERRLKEAMKNDRARLQIGRMSPFGLMELSRQRLRPSLQEIIFEKCPHCAGVGQVRSPDSAALSVLRVIEEEGIKQKSSEITVTVATRIALYLLNQKRPDLTAIESRYQMHVIIAADDTLVPPDYKLERAKTRLAIAKSQAAAVNFDQVLAEAERELPPLAHDHSSGPVTDDEGDRDDQSRRPNSRRRGRFRTRRRDRDDDQTEQQAAPEGSVAPASVDAPEGDSPAANQKEQSEPRAPRAPRPPRTDRPDHSEGTETDDRPRRRRGRRGGRRRSGTEGEGLEHRPRFEAGQEGAAPAVYAPSFPTSVHEIDTTPRDPATERPHNRVSSAHEIVNPPTDKPKGGWWHRLTGQED